MTFHVYMQMPSGAVSKGKDFEDMDVAIAHAQKLFIQLDASGTIGASVVTRESGEYKKTEEVDRKTVTPR